LFDEWLLRGTKLGLSRTEHGEETRAEVICGYDAGHIAIVARVNDASPRQNAKLGYIGSQDSLIIGVDAKADTSSAGYQKDDFEAGFALKDDNQILKYRWDGRYGLESAVPFDEAEVNIFRENGATFYIIRVPVAEELESGGAIRLALRITNLTAAKKPTVLRFADGLGEPRDASLFGIVNLE